MNTPDEEIVRSNITSGADYDGSQQDYAFPKLFLIRKNEARDMTMTLYSGHEEDRDFVGPPTPWELQELCDTCDGDGVVLDDRGQEIDCPACGGHGWTVKED